jgi:cell division transport system permease protein
MTQLFRTALQNIIRNIWLSLATVLVVLLMLSFLSGFLTFRVLSQKIMTSLNDKVDITVYLNQNSPADQVNILRSELDNMNEVKKLTYVSPEKTLEQFQKKYQNNKIIAKTLDEIGDNPFGASLQVKLDKPQSFEKVLGVINQAAYQPIIYNKDFYDYARIIGFLNNFNSRAYWILTIIGFILIFVTFLVINTAIRLGIYARREEIKIMRLVGAKNSTIQVPFILEACWLSFFAWCLIVVLFFLLSGFFGAQIQIWLGLDFDFLSYLKSVAVYYLSGLLLFSLIIAILSSWIATKKYIR